MKAKRVSETPGRTRVDRSTTYGKVKGLLTCSSVRSSTDPDAAAQQTEQSYAWQDKVRESMTSGKGLKDAFAWRDDPYEESKLK